MTTLLEKPPRNNPLATTAAPPTAPAREPGTGSKESATVHQPAAPTGNDNPPPQVPAKKRRRSLLKRLLTVAVLGTLLTAGGIYGYHYWQWSTIHESTDDAFIDGDVAQISPRVSGHVLKVDIRDNQEVEAGQVLVELDPRDFQAALDEATGKVTAAEADLKSVQSQVVQAQAQITAAQAAVDQAKSDQAARQAQYDQAHSNEQQYAKAKTAGIVSPVEWTQIETQVRTAKAELDASQKAVSAASAQVAQAQATYKSQQSRVAVSQAQIETAKAAQETASLNLSYTKVIAAGPGRVTNKSVEPGDYVSPGAAMLALVAPRVWVTANFKETQLTHMKPGQPVEITVDAYPDATFHGHVDSVQQGSGARFSLLPPENATGNYVKVLQRVPAKIVFDGPIDSRYLLGPGMSAVPVVTTGK